MPWEARRRLPGYQTKIRATLYNQDYLAVILDEAHEFRNPGPKHNAAYEILQSALVRLIMTATPLQTSIRVRNVNFTCSIF